MKMLLAILLCCTNLLIACQDSQQISNGHAHNIHISEDHYSDIYDTQTLEEEALLDYEQHVCDSIKPPKTSYITALLTNVGCTLLIQYITLKEKTKKYMYRLKQTLEKGYVYMRRLLL